MEAYKENIGGVSSALVNPRHHLPVHSKEDVGDTQSCIYLGGEAHQAPKAKDLTSSTIKVSHGLR